MPRWLRVVLAIVVVLGVVGAGAWLWLTARTPVPETTSFVLDLAEVRRLAASLPGDRATRVNNEQVAVASLPRGAVFAGQSPFEPLSFTHGAYQVVFPDGFIVIDAAVDEQQLRQMDAKATFDAAGYAAVQEALGTARAIVVTHEHADHIGGLVRRADPSQLVGRLLLTKEQLANTADLDRAGFPAELRERLKPLEYDRYLAVAPGVVLIKAPGHTPGSQMVYVALANGTELIFLGDIAWHMDQIRQLWYRPRLVTDLFLGEDRDAVMAQFRALHDLPASPPVQLVASHDVEQRRALIDAHVLGEHFER
ncbi:MAG TPA: MBL fold metallo-hydrolase [Candidatus Binatia bacterium]|jgi:glyoxylase-like metal-dependent hydrolase (beta-lactamase superfamily II)|nr:MBL fold metallo-hydrolase [Candidatus Binatia bacterium]